MAEQTLAEIISKDGSDLAVLDAVEGYNEQKRSCFAQLEVIQTAVDSLDTKDARVAIALTMALAKLITKQALQGKGLGVDNVLKGAKAISGCVASSVGMEAYLASLAEKAN